MRGDRREPVEQWIAYNLANGEWGNAQWAVDEIAKRLREGKEMINWTDAQVMRRIELKEKTMEQYMTEARMLAAQCFCNEDTSGIEMDARLAEAVARKFAPILADAARLREAMETIASFAPGNGDVCEIIAQRARKALMPNA